MGDKASVLAGVGEIRPGHEIDAARLQAWLADHVEGFAGLISIQRFKGEQSNPTSLFIARGPGATASPT